jgi:hypothetical protein
MKIYILAPEFKSGGPENLHQLCSYLNEIGAETYIYYFANLQRNTSLYDFPNIKIAKAIEDNPKNIVIVPEVYSLKNIKKNFISIRYALWWLSYTNACLHNTVLENVQEDCIHLFHSYYEYAMITPYLSPHVKYFFITDYIHPDFMNAYKIIDRKNQIAYNYTKDKITPVLCNKLGIPSIPIHNMSRQEIIDTLNTCKVYVDNGYHPGKDHLPREAAMCGCVVVTNKCGSAAYYEDVPIEEKLTYKKDFELLIPQIFKNYNFYFNKQNNYRDKIEGEEKLFRENIKAFIEQIKSD